jgi:hypothetical protein
LVVREKVAPRRATRRHSPIATVAVVEVVDPEVRDDEVGALVREWHRGGAALVKRHVGRRAGDSYGENWSSGTVALFYRRSNPTRGAMGS